MANNQKDMVFTSIDIRHVSTSSCSGDFVIRGFDCNDAEGKISFHYCYAGGTEFTEVLDFGRPFPPASNLFRKCLNEAFKAIAVLAGVSYYKAFAPDNIVIDIPGLSDEQIEFFREIYFHGLGEFAYRNKIDLSNKLNFQRGDSGSNCESAQIAASANTVFQNPSLERRSAVLIGGGKDSLVSVETLRAANEPMLLFAVNPKKPIVDCARESGIPLVTVWRHLDPKLFELNASGALNGHVPITAIISFIAIAAAFIHGFDAVILSNERSANEGTLEHAGNVINHQFSKTTSAEDAIANYTATHISPTVQYFSLLRPLSEAHIGQLFAKTDRYDHVFTSCNRAFRLLQTQVGERWCCDCPKCRFTFLMLAAAMPPARLLKIFGKNLLDDRNQLAGYEELVELSGHKPWECVGEVAESSAAILKLLLDPFWKQCWVVRNLAERLAPLLPRPDRVWSELLTPSSSHSVPPRYESMLNAYVETV